MKPKKSNNRRRVSRKNSNSKRLSVKNKQMWQEWLNKPKSREVLKDSWKSKNPKETFRKNIEKLHREFSSKKHHSKKKH